ncbi:MAG: serine/threonine protein kinase [Deltaproteobacteria bacterium]|nr:serine/threonine protein kinase [Deltaproteobacteria bacterium]
MTSIRTIDMSYLVGRDVGSSTVLKEIGRGSMALVFEAYQRSLKRKIALKILPKSLMTAVVAERFQLEAEAAAILSHPNIIPIYEIGEGDNFLFMSMQMVQGYDLAQYLDRAGKHVVPSKRVLPLPATINIIIQVLDALGYAHSQGIIHRDIKPANILIEKQSKRPLISDFGTAKLMRGEDLGAGVILGTPLYMPPEQISTSEVDGRADIYAVGTLLFQMIVQKLPLPEYDFLVSLLKQKQKNRRGIFQKTPSQLNPALNLDMDRIVAKALAYEREDRFADCAAFARALKWYRNRYLKA